ncbi:hypothetical protein FZEAL_2182 [Fusarium zealandicum]|uniref:DUF7598 domain-containing protein n=1 Tax=Fusarium zealandicum TaxID=1053134 RepID=A0A8H4US07_9HYPO|nr:hypothetical protein FZEAL_2182 [Fusarium zealandicum]
MFGEGIRGPGMIFLQGLRAVTLIGLTAAAIACWILLIKIDTSNGFFFFDAASLFFTSSASVFLCISELPIAQSYFRRTWPVISDEHGLTWLGVAMALIGCNILGKLNQPANSSDKMGLPFWRLVLAAGILVITFGVMNIIASFIFRDGDNGINARIVRAEGSLAQAREEDSFSKPSLSRSGSMDEKPKSAFVSFFWKKRSAKTSPPTSRPNISQPMPRDHDIERNAPPHYNQSESEDEWDQDRRSPIVPEIRRPDTALHPIHTGRTSHYSEAHMSRF